MILLCFETIPEGLNPLVFTMNEVQRVVKKDAKDGWSYTIMINQGISLNLIDRPLASLRPQSKIDHYDR